MNSYPKNYHPADIAEIKRMISNLIRQGTIHQVDGDRVKVQSGEIITAWLPWFTHRAGKNKTWWQPSIGEQVFILSPNGNLELGSVLPSLYSDDNPTPSLSENGYVVEFSDGASFEYEPKSSTLKVSNVKTAVFQAENKITLDAPEVECTTKLTTKDFKTTGDSTLSGDVTHTGSSLSSNGVTLDKHQHSGVYPGGAMTGNPT